MKSIRIAIAASLICVGFVKSGGRNNFHEGISCMVDGEYKCVSNEEASYVAA